MFENVRTVKSWLQKEQLRYGYEFMGKVNFTVVQGIDVVFEGKILQMPMDMLDTQIFDQPVYTATKECTIFI